MTGPYDLSLERWRGLTTLGFLEEAHDMGLEVVKRCVEQRTALSDDEHLGGLDIITPDPLMHKGRPVPLTRIRGRIGRLVIPILDVVGDERQRYDDLIGVTGYWNLHDAYELRQAALDLPVEGRAEGSGQSQTAAEIDANPSYSPNMVIDELRRESMGYSELEIISGVLEISLNTLVKIKNGQPVDMAMASFGRFRDNPRPLTGLK